MITFILDLNFYFYRMCLSNWNFILSLSWLRTRTFQDLIVIVGLLYPKPIFQLEFRLYPLILLSLHFQVLQVQYQIVWRFITPTKLSSFIEFCHFWTYQSSQFRKHLKEEDLLELLTLFSIAILFNLRQLHYSKSVIIQIEPFNAFW